MSTQKIGGLIAELTKRNPKARVYVDGVSPTRLASYRGFYDQLAIERRQFDWDRTELSGRGGSYGDYTPGHSGVHIRNNATVADLITALQLAIGEEFEGYKGGQFRMDEDTILWVSEYGDCDSRRVFDIREEADGSVNLITYEVDLW